MSVKRRRTSASNDATAVATGLDMESPFTAGAPDMGRPSAAAAAPVTGRGLIERAPAADTGGELDAASPAAATGIQPGRIARAAAAAADDGVPEAPSPVPGATGQRLIGHVCAEPEACLTYGADFDEGAADVAEMNTSEGHCRWTDWFYRQAAANPLLWPLAYKTAVDEFSAVVSGEPKPTSTLSRHSRPFGFVSRACRRQCPSRDGWRCDRGRWYLCCRTHSAVTANATSHTSNRPWSPSSICCTNGVSCSRCASNGAPLPPCSAAR